MKFNKELHQKVKYDGQLYAVILEEFPDYYKKKRDAVIVIHPMSNDWIVQITNPEVRKHLMVKKGSATEVAPEVMG